MNPPAKILIVDDDGTVREMLDCFLRQEGHDCRTAEDGASGLEALRVADFDVVFVDFRMPRMNGIEFLAELKRSNRDAIPIVLTGHAEVAQAVEAMKLG